MLFDLDGTLVEFKFDVKASRRAMIEWLRQQGFDISGLTENTRTQSIIDIAALQWKTRGRSEKGFEAIRESLSDILDEFEFNAFGEAKPHSGALQTLEALKHCNILEAIITNSGRKPVDSILDRFGFSKYVDLVITRNEVRSLKPNPEGLIKAINILHLKTNEVVYVGDSIIDIEAAKNAGITSIAVSNGMYSQEALARFGADYLVNGVEDITGIVTPESI